MSVQRFPSKVDTWVVIVMAAVLVAQAGMLVGFAMSGPSAAALALMLAVTVGVYLLIGLMFARTVYEVDGRELRIVCGPFRWRVPLEAIEAVEATRSAASSPALSLDRLRIRYGNGRRVLVSPADKLRFRKALAMDPAGTGT